MGNKSARTGVENNVSARASLSKAALQRRTPQRGRDSCRRGQARCVSHNVLCSVAKKRLRNVTFRSRWGYCAKIIKASAGGLVFVFFGSHLPAVLVPALDRLRQARHRAAAAGAAGAVVAEAADHERSAFFLFGRAPHPWLRHQEAG